MASFPDVDVPLVADMSSDYVSRPVPWIASTSRRGAEEPGSCGARRGGRATDLLEQLRTDLPATSDRTCMPKDS